MSAPYSELETPLSEYSLVCRGCLANSGEMKNMYEWGLWEMFCKITEIQVESPEDISKLLCTTCEQTLLTCKQFRAQCQKSDVALKKMVMKKSPEITKDNNLKNSTTFILHDKKLMIMILAPNTEEKIYLSCPFHCTDGFTKKRNLYLHLNKVHNVSKDFEIELQYYCHSENCAYNITSDKNKWFSERKFLNQHYNKVHKEKVFKCSNCNALFPMITDLNRHLKECNTVFVCQLCNIRYKTNEKLLVHLLRRHPELHKEYKEERRAEKRKIKEVTEGKRQKTDTIVNSPRKSLATQIPENIESETLIWQSKNEFEARTDEISTQTVFEDLLSLKSQNSEDDIFFSESVSLSDIQTQTFPIDFGLSRSNKETQSCVTSTQSPDLSIKETQTCFCHFDSPRPNFRLFDSLSSSPASINLTSTETQTADARFVVKSDVMLSFNSAETQTCFDDSSNDSM